MEQSYILYILLAISGILIIITTIIFMIFCLIKKDKPPIKIEKDTPVLTDEELAMIDSIIDLKRKQRKTIQNKIREKEKRT